MGSPLPLPLLSVSFSEHRIVGQQGERYPENKAQGAEPLLSLTSTRLFSQILSSFFLNFVGVTRDPRWGVAASYQEQEPPRGTSSDIIVHQTHSESTGLLRQLWVRHFRGRNLENDS